MKLKELQARQAKLRSRLLGGAQIDQDPLEIARLALDLEQVEKEMRAAIAHGEQD